MKYYFDRILSDIKKNRYEPFFPSLNFDKLAEFIESKKQYFESENDIIEYHLILIILEKEFNKKNLDTVFSEGTGWIDTGNGYYYRTDPPRPENMWRREICIAHKKNKHSVPQWTWHNDGTRKDLHKFTKEPPNIVKKFAANFFGKDIDFLEAYIVMVNSKNKIILLG